MAYILFSHSYFYRFDPKQWRTGQPYPPLGTIYAAALMREEGHKVSLYDTNLIENTDSLEPVISAERPRFFVIYDDGFNYLTKMCLTNMREAAFEMAKLGKKYGCTVIVCSSDSTDHYEDYLREGADFVIHGEGELALSELVSSIENGQSTDEIKGISYLTDGGVHKNAPRPVLKELDSLPMAAWDLVDIESYRAIWLKNQGFFSLNIATTRGCPYKCNWCAKPIYGNRYNTRSPEKVVDEIRFLMESFNVHYFWMCDDIFGLKPGWVQKFKELVQAQSLDFKYKIQSRVDLLLKEDNIQALADSGLDTVWVGAESGSQKILDAMDKGTQVEQIEQATQLLKQKGVRVAFFLQFGYLDETMEDIQKTISMVLKLMPDEIGISVSYPLPGTKFYDMVKSDLKVKSNWTDSDDLDMMFKNTYNKAFYRTLHVYMHNRYRIRKGVLSLQRLLSHPFKWKKSVVRDVAAMVYHLPQALKNKFLLDKFARKAP